MVAHCFAVIAKVTKGLGITDFRVVSNCGPQAGRVCRTCTSTFSPEGI